MPPVHDRPARKSPNVEIRDDSQENDMESVKSKKAAAASDGESSWVVGTELGTPLKRDRLEKKTTVVHRLSSVSHQLKRITSVTGSSSKPPGAPAGIDWMKSTASKGLKFISKTGGDSGWGAVEKQFNEITKKTNGLLPRSKFSDCIGMNPKEFALELFDALARRRKITDEAITKDQLKEFWDQISNESFESRLQTFFDMIDKDADGILTEDEVKEIISLSASANKLSRVQQRADEYAAFIMEELDRRNRGYIVIDDLRTLLLQASTPTAITRKKTNLRRTQSQNPKPTQNLNPLMQQFRDMGYFVLDNAERVWVIALWLTVMAVLFAYKFIQYKHRAVYQVMGDCVCVAKGAGEILKLNMALILLPVCRNTLTWLRNNTGLGGVVPFDDNINFHKVIAVAITIGVGMHVITHMACDFPRLLTATPEAYSPLKQYFGDVQPASYWHFVSSVEGTTGILMVLLMAVAFTLATPWFRQGKLKYLPGPLKKLASFNTFWYTHHLFIIVYALLVVHGHFLYLTHEWYKKTTWMYLAVPVTLYACERLIRLLRSNMKEVKVIKADPDPGKELGLYMSRPDNFKYKSGQYLFVKCPAVSPFEWHPFSITSAPQDDYLSINIKNRGDWTEAIIGLFSEVTKPPPNEVSGLPRAGKSHGANNLIYPKVKIDGPYGAPAQDYKKYEVVLLVGLGIGATPMISIVKDIVNNIKAEEEVKPSLMESAESKLSEESFRTRKAYFYWITPEQCSFDWFKNTMNEVAKCDHNHVIELHNYCSKVYEEGDVRSAFIAMLQSLYYSKKGFDIVSGTRVMSHFAKPKWGNVYKRIETKHPDTEVGVFYCGIPEAGKDLKHLANEFTHNPSTTKFSFHKENF